MNHDTGEPGLQWRLALRQVMTELSEQGWTVAEPRSSWVDWLPEPLRPFKPDLVAVKDGEIRVFEVKSRHSDDRGELSDLAAAVAGVPNARFDVVWAGATVDGAVSGITGRSVARLSAEARELLASGHLEAAALIAWSAIEGALLHYARALDVPPPGDATSSTLPWRLLAELDSLGCLNEGDRLLITGLRRQRNAAAHFMESGDRPEPTGIEACLDIANRMQSGRYVSVDQMTDWYESLRGKAGLPISRDEQHIRQSLAEIFPGARSSDVQQSAKQLLRASELAHLRQNTSRLQEAEAEFREAIRLDPTSAVAHNNLGFVLEGAKRYADAEAEFREAIRLDPTLIAACRNLGDVMWRTNRLQEAEAAYREAIRLDPASAVAHNCLGLVLEKTERQADAEASYREAIRLDPAFTEARDNLRTIVKITARRR